MVEPLDEDDPVQLGPYVLLGRLGQGGMGTVFLGRRAAADEPDSDAGGPLVAVKMIRPDLAREPEFRERFLREATAARRVARFCTAEVLDVEVESRRPYLVTEYIDGRTLAAAVREDGPLPSAEVERLAVAVASALTAIHAAGLVHRDLKPGNIMLSPSGARVIDFGIARALDAATTFTHTTIGTPAFMAPEQAVGGTVAPPADIYAWGGVVLYAATGRLPHGEGPGPVVLYRAVNEQPDLTGLDPGLRQLVAQAMAKDPASRPTARDLLLRLVGASHVDEPARPEPGPAAGAAHHAGGDTVNGDTADGGRDTSDELGAGEATTADPTEPRGSATTTDPPTRAATTFVPSRPRADRAGDGLAQTAAGPAAMPADARQPTRRRLARRFVGLRGGLVGENIVAVAPFGEPLAGHTGDVLSVAFAPDGATLATTSADGAVRLWSVGDAGAVAFGAPLRGHEGRVLAAAFSPDGRVLATGGGDHTARLWRLGAMTSQIADLPDPLRRSSGNPAAGPAGTPGGHRELGVAFGHTDQVTAVAFGPAGRLLASASLDGTARLWEVDRAATGPAAVHPVGRPLTGHQGKVLAAAFSPGGELLATAGTDHTVLLWDLSSSVPRTVGRPLADRGWHARSIAFFPDGRLLAVGAGFGTVVLWDITDPARPYVRTRMTNPRYGQVHRIAVSADGHTLAVAASGVAGVGGATQLWNVEDLARPDDLGQLPAGPAGPVRALDFSPAADLLATAGDATVRLWQPG
ncbi:WD40 repeat domain-containing serine/threonine protein kinase [Frankia nepalensis]|nr:serine/threonine-protein kinase [Frankia nepalensis]